MKLQQVECCICGGRGAEPYARGWDFEYATTREEFTFVRCCDCGHLYLNPRPATEALPVIYPPEYYAYDLSKTINPLALHVKRLMEKKKIRKLLRYCEVKKPRCLDIGCGDGRLLDLLAREGVPPENLSGVELDPDVVESLKARGYHGYHTSIEALDLPAGSYDLILMLQVIEHVADPAIIFREVSRLLAPGGVFIVETPNAASLDARIFRKRYWGGYHFPRHWNLFNRMSLIRLGEACGLGPVGTDIFICAVFWCYPFHHWLREHGAPRPVYRFFWPLNNPALLAAATLIDLVLAPFGLTSNLRGVFKKVG